MVDYIYGMHLDHVESNMSRRLMTGMLLHAELIYGT